MSMSTEFREFALKATSWIWRSRHHRRRVRKIVDSLVKDLIMPIVGRIFGGLDFSNWFIMLGSPPPATRADDLRGADQSRCAAVRLRQTSSPSRSISSSSRSSSS